MGAAIVSLPAVAQARPLALASTGAALCSGVSASQVSGVVGWSVPAPTETTEENVFDKKLHIHEDDTVCTYGTVKSVTSLGHLVTFSYATLSSAPSRTTALADIKASFKKSQSQLGKGSKITYSISNTFGVTSLFAKVIASQDGFHFTFEFAYGWKGTRVAGALVDSGVPESTAQALEKLALGNFGV
jgi:hypothetical protein